MQSATDKMLRLKSISNSLSNRTPGQVMLRTQVVHVTACCRVPTLRSTAVLYTLSL